MNGYRDIHLAEKDEEIRHLRQDEMISPEWRQGQVRQIISAVMLRSLSQGETGGMRFDEQTASRSTNKKQHVEEEMRPESFAMRGNVFMFRVFHGTFELFSLLL